MIRVSTKEFRNRIAHYLRLVELGARILVTENGRPVAELGPVAHAEEDPEQAWTLAAARGQVTLPTRRRFTQCRPVRLPKGVRLSDAVIEDRGSFAAAIVSARWRKGLLGRS